MELVKWIESINDLHYGQTLKQLSELISKNCEWSDYVDNIWRNEFNQIGSYPYVEKCETEEYIWFVSKEPIRNDNKYLIAHVVTLVPREKPSCLCPNFQSSKIPCRGRHLNFLVII